MTTHTFDFEANSQPWFQSNVRLNTGDKFRLDVEIKEELKYTGHSKEHPRTLAGGGGDSPTNPPQRANNEYIAQGLWADGIIGQIGEGVARPGEAFDVESGHSYEAKKSGFLQITVNEKSSADHENNEGKLKFTVTILDRASQGKLVVAKYGSDQARIPRAEKSRQHSTDIEVEPAALEIIYDSSGSMAWDLKPGAREPGPNGENRREVALEAFAHLLDSGLLEETRVALRVFGPQLAGTNIVAGGESTLVSPLTNFSVTHAGDLRDIVKALTPDGGTPIARSLEAAKQDLAGAGVSVVTVLTDGQANDENAVEAAASSLGDSVKLVLNIVGFSLTDALKKTYTDLAAANNGTFVSIDDQKDATTNLETAVGISFEILQGSSKVGNRYNVGGPAIDLAPGNYTLKMLIPGAPTTTPITIEAGKTTLIET